MVKNREKEENIMATIYRIIEGSLDELGNTPWDFPAWVFESGEPSDIVAKIRKNRITDDAYTIEIYEADENGDFVQGSDFDTPSSFCERYGIRAARKEARMSVRETAALLGIPTRTLEEWEACRRNPKTDRKVIADRIRAFGELTREGRMAYLDGVITLEEVMEEHKLNTAKKVSKWGDNGDTFRSIIERIPEDVYEALDGEQLGHLVDAMK